MFVNLIYVLDIVWMDDMIFWDYGVFLWVNIMVLVENVYFYCVLWGFVIVCCGFFGCDVFIVVLEFKL